MRNKQVMPMIIKDLRYACYQTNFMLRGQIKLWWRCAFTIA